MEPNQYEENEIDLREILFALKRKIVLIILIGILGGIVSGVYTYFFISPIYSTSSRIIVLTKDTTLSSIADLQLGTSLTKDYKELLTSPPPLKQVVENLNLDFDYKKLYDMLTVENPSNSRILVITVKHSDPELAADIVNELAEVASDFISEVMEITPPKIIAEGEVPTEKTSPSLTKNVLIGGFVGVALCIAVIAGLIILDDTIKSEEDIEKYLGVSMLASVPDRKDYVSGKKTRHSHKSKTGMRTDDNERDSTAKRS